MRGSGSRSLQQLVTEEITNRWGSTTQRRRNLKLTVYRTLFKSVLLNTVNKLKPPEHPARPGLLHHLLLGRPLFEKLRIGSALWEA